jgi:hypothetical protein
VLPSNNARKPPFPPALSPRPRPPFLQRFRPAIPPVIHSSLRAAMSLVSSAPWALRSQSSTRNPSGINRILHSSHHTGGYTPQKRTSGETSSNLNRSNALKSLESCSCITIRAKSNGIIFLYKNPRGGGLLDQFLPASLCVSVPLWQSLPTNLSVATHSPLAGESRSRASE